MPERTAFARFRKEFVRHEPDEAPFEEMAAQRTARAVTVKIGTLDDATLVDSVGETDKEARWFGHRSRKAVHGYMTNVAAGADSAIACNSMRTLNILNPT